MIKNLLRFNPLLAIFVGVSLCIISPKFAEAGNEKTVALVMKSLSNPFFSKMEEGARQYAQSQNLLFEVFGVERETDVKHQISIVENLISREYGAIVIAPTDSKKLVPICKKAMEKGIVVINIDNPFHRETMEQTGISIPFIGSDNYIGAQMIGEYVRDKLNGRGRVLVIEGIRGVENADQRKNGFIEAVTRDSSVEIVASESANWHTDEALTLTVELLNEHGSINAIFCANDAMALGAYQAIEMFDLTSEILIAGYDNIDSVRTEIRGNNIHATIEQHPELMGAYGIEEAWKKLNGIEIPSYRATPLDLITHEHFNKTVAFSIADMGSPFFSIMIEDARAAADQYGIELIVLNAKNKDTQQLTDIAYAISQNVDLLIVNPTNKESILPGIEFANNKNTPVITVDRKAAAGKVLCHIESDNEQGGRMAAKVLAQHLHGKGRVLELEGIPGTSAAEERGKGFNEEIERLDGIEIAYREVANFDRQEAKAITLQILRMEGRIDGVFAHNDPMILGVIDAFEEAGKDLPKALVGFDAIPEAKRMIQQNKLTATIAQEPRTMGRLAVGTAARYFRGSKVTPVKFVELTLETK